MSESMEEKLRSLEELGAKLREIRTERSLTLENVAEAICVRKNFLEDIEAGTFENFIALVYARGFVRSYAEYLEAPELWQEYSVQLTPESFSGLPRRQSQRQKNAAQTPSRGSSVSPAAQTQGFKQSNLRKKCIVVLLLIIIAGCGALWANWDRIGAEIVSVQQKQALDAEQSRRAQDEKLEAQKKAEMEAAERERLRREEEAQKAQSVVSLDAAESAAAPAPAPADSSPVQSQEQPAEQKPESAPKKVLVVRASGECWLRLTQGEKLLTERTVKKDYERSFDLNRAIIGRFGAGHRIEVSVNGAPFAPIGKGVRRLEFRPDGTIVELRK